MIQQITYDHFLRLGALCNPGCSSRYQPTYGRTLYYYSGVLADACNMEWNKTSPGLIKQ